MTQQPLLGICPKKAIIEKDTCTPMFAAALFTIARTYNQPRCSSTDEWIKMLWYIYTMEYYLAIKRNVFESVLMIWMNLEPIQFSSVQFSRLAVSDSLWPQESQHARPTCPSPSPGVHSDSGPLSSWWHPAISSSVVHFSQSLPTSESFPMSQLFAWGGQSTGVSALASFLPKKSQGWSPSNLL